MARLKKPLSVWMLRIAFLAAAATVIPACGRAGAGIIVVPFSITTSSLPGGVVGTAYSETLTVTSQTDPVTWSILSGSLPGGLVFGVGTGAITGSPSGSASVSTFTIRAVDANGQVAQRSFQLTITGGAPAALAVTTTTPLPGGDLSTYYDFGFSASGGAPGYTWAVTAGVLPTGLTLNPANGGLTGTPTTAATFNFTIQATDTALATATLACSLTIAPALTITSSTLPSGTVGAAYSQPVPSLGGTAPLLYSLNSGTLPTSLVFNAGPGTVTGTPTVAETTTVVIRVTDAAGVTQLASLTLTINPAPTVTTTTLADWTQDQAGYSQTLGATSGTPGYSWAVTVGTLPTGLLLNVGTGAVTGTPTAAGTTNFTVTVTDSVGGIGTKALSITVNLPVTVTPISLQEWTINRPAYSQTVAATGGTGSHTWTVTVGSLPAGLLLNAASGAITGTPTAAATTNFTVTATDTVGATGSLAVSIKVNVLPLITTSSAPDWTADFLFTDLLVGNTGGTAPLSWSTTGTLPTGLTLGAATGILSGTPTAAGTFDFSVVLTDAAGASTSQAMTVVVAAALSVTTATPMAPWTQGKSGYSQTVAASGGTGAQTWSISVPALPISLSIAPSTGAITGTPSAAGTFNFTVQVTDAVGATATKAMSIVINAPLSVTNGVPLAPWTQNKSGYSQTLTATGGTGAQSWSLTPGPLPTGLNLAAGTGAITGTPTAAGTFNFTVTVTDAVGATGSLAETIVISDPLSVTTGATLAAWTQGKSGYNQALAATGGTGAQTWSNPGGGMPTGLSIVGAAITGTPTSAPGVYTFNLLVTDSVNATGSLNSASITINAPVSILTASPLPDGSQSISYTQGFSSSGGTGAIAWSATPSPNPVPGLTMSAGGSLSGTPTTGGAFLFDVTATDSVGASTTLSNVSLFILAPLTVTTSSLPDATASAGYVATAMAATGGRAPYVWSLLSGSLPTGITLSGAGVWGGTAPAANGSSAFVVKVTDADNRTATQALSIATTGGSAGSVSILTASLSAATQGSPYSVGLQGSGGTPGSYSWTVTSGALPLGLSLASATGVISGTPTATAPSFDITLDDGATNATQTFTITVNPALGIATSSPLPEWTINRSAYPGSLSPSGGTAPYIWAISSGAPPSGLTLNTDGTFSGTPTVSGPAVFGVQVSDAAGAITSGSMSLTINPAPVVSTTTPMAQWTQDKSGYSQTLTATGGTGAQTWSLILGSLPTGLGPLTSGGLISGTPTASGTFNFTAQVTDAAGATDSKALSITINVAPSITTGATLPGGTEGLAYNQSVAGTGGTGGLSFSMTGGSLPTGVTFSGTTFSGTPAVSTAATYNPQITVTDGVGATGSKIFTLVIGNSPQVQTVTPATTSPTVNTDTNLVITFNMSMVKSEVEANFSLSPLAGSPVHSFFWDVAGLNGTTMTVVFDTAAPFTTITGDDLLADNATYTWTISAGAHSASALVMPQQTGQFKTNLDGTEPSITSITPDPTAGILTNVTGFVLVFNEAMDTSGSNGTAEVQVQGPQTDLQASEPTTTGSITIQWTDPTTLTVGFASALPANSAFRMEFRNLRDANGNYLNDNVRYTVITSGAGLVAPVLTGSHPANGAVGVSRDTAIFLAVNEVLSPDVVSQISVTGTGVPAFKVRYEAGNGPLGVQVTPLTAWPASTVITVTIPVTVTNASGVAFAASLATRSISFTTGTTGAGTNAIVIDAPYSSLKDGMTDCSTYSGPQGEILFKDSVTNARVFLSDTTLVNSAISVTDPNGIPVKSFVVNTSDNEGEAGRSLQFTSRNGQGVTSLQFATTYTVAFKGTITGSVGQSFAPTNYTFTTVPDSFALARTSPNFNNFNASTEPGPSRKVEVQVDLSGGGGGNTNIQSVAAAVGSTTDYTISSNPGWIANGVSVTISGCSGANNGTFLVSAVSGGGPVVVTVNNAAGVLEALSSGQMGPPYAITFADVTGGNTFSTNLALNGYSYEYKSSGNEATIATSGVHTFRYTVADGVAGHLLNVDTDTFFFTGADMSALTLTGSPPAGGSTPTYTWTGTTPAAATALFLQVKDASDNEIYGWVIPPGSTSFTQPANSPLPNGSYTWTLGFYHSLDGTIRDNGGGNGQLAPIPFTRP